MPKKPNQPTPQERRRSRKAFRQAMTKELREHRSSFLVFSVLRVLILVALVRQLMRGSYESAFFCVLALVLLYLPSWLQVKLRVELPPPLEITILCFIFAAEILGEVNAFYVVVPNWDTMLHTLNGFLAAAVGLSMVILLNDNEKVVFDLSPFFLALLAFCFSTAGGLILGKIMYKVTGGKINPLIGSAGVSAVPMAARVSQVEGQKANPANFLLMHAMGPNVAGVIGSAIAAGFLLAVFG